MKKVIKKIQIQCVVIAIPLSKCYFMNMNSLNLVLYCVWHESVKNRIDLKKIKRSISEEKENGLSFKPQYIHIDFSCCCCSSGIWMKAKNKFLLIKNKIIK